MVPYFGTDEKVFSLDFSTLLLQEIMHGITNFAFVLVKPGTIKMPDIGLYVKGTAFVKGRNRCRPIDSPITCVQCCLCRLIRFSGFPLACKGSESNSRNVCSCVQREFPTQRHYESMRGGLNDRAASGRGFSCLAVGWEFPPRPHLRYYFEA